MSDITPRVAVIYTSADMVENALDYYNAYTMSYQRAVRVITHTRM